MTSANFCGGEHLGLLPHQLDGRLFFVRRIVEASQQPLDLRSHPSSNHT